MSLSRRVITSVSWTAASNATRTVALLIRSVLLARWLPVETFGIYGFAAAVVGLTVPFTSLGLGAAFLHRALETEDEDRAAATHFVLKLALTLAWAALLVAGAFLFARGPARVALLVLIVAHGGVQLTDTPKLILARRIVHRRLAILGLTNALLSSALSLWLAWPHGEGAEPWRGATLWALLAGDLVSLVTSVVILYAWRPVWPLHVSWSPKIARYLLRFGSRSFVVGLLWTALDRVDDLWTGRYLGPRALGFYSRAYAFATSPRGVLGGAVNAVAGGALAELKHDRTRLSRAFFQTAALLVRGGFFFAGLLALVTPEFVRLALSPKWSPALGAIRLMLAFTMLDPLRKVLAHLFTAVGHPERSLPSLLVRLLVLVVGLSVLGPRLGIVGVALAMDAMMVTGTAMLLWQAREHVDFSLARLFAIPGIALATGMLLARGAVNVPGVLGSDWRSGIVKAVVFITVYGSTVLAVERRQVTRWLSLLREAFE